MPLSGVHEARQRIRAVRRDIARVVAPTLAMHAIEVDVASPRSAEFAALKVGAPEVRTILYRNSCHILTIDNDKQSVADETIGFFRSSAGAAAEQSEESGEGQMPKLLSVA
jgi:carboxylesterase